MTDDATPATADPTPGALVGWVEAGQEARAKPGTTVTLNARLDGKAFAVDVVDADGNSEFSCASPSQLRALMDGYLADPESEEAS